MSEACVLPGAAQTHDDRFNSSNFCAISYLNNPAATSESFDDEGWFHTGDVGKFDAQGNLYIVDRLKEILKIKG